MMMLIIIYSGDKSRGHAQMRALEEEALGFIIHDIVACQAHPALVSYDDAYNYLLW